ncbi:hypothetical protein C8R44DRAFT_866646 [Mycena epipterygia]|nr:hypothetical protein C8R44DRAFT_866646 [Mycena epipterygia]
MLDPITATTTIITLATFIKDLIEVGQSIKTSIEKVAENRRRIRDLMNDILHTLADLASLSRGHEDEFKAPALLSALANLKADMLYVLSICRKISPAERSPGLRGFGVQIKVWMKRDNVETEIKRLKEHVNQCYSKFTAFSAARIEKTAARIEGTSCHAVNTTLRVEQTLILNNVENQVRLRRLEGMMARVLLETQFGQNIMNETIETIASDTTHKSLEFQYLSTQALRFIDTLQHWQLITKNTFVVDTPLWDGTKVVFAKFKSSEHILYQILGALLKIKDFPTEISFTSIEGILNLGFQLDHLGMNREATAWELMVIQILRRLRMPAHAEVIPHLALSSKRLSELY